MYNFIVIDDDPANNIICKVLIKNHLNPADIKTFSTPQEGLEYIRKSYQNVVHEHQTILFLDINMPVMSGWDFLKEFEKLDKQLRDQFKIYILSSSVDDNDLKRAKENKDVIGYIVKPLTKEKVIETFKNVL
jgi:CheY-like chemotaxis protein